MVRRQVGRGAHEVLTPDVETATAGYASRFAGPTGRWLLDVQLGLVSSLLDDAAEGRPLRILELAGGHGQLCGGLAAQGHMVTVQGSRPESLRPLLAGGSPVQLACSGLWRLPFPDAAFDAVIAVRLLSHVAAWRELLAEMARVTRNLLLVDFAPAGQTALGPLAYRLKQRYETQLRPYFTYRPSELDAALRAVDLEPAGARRELAVPFVVHRVLHSPRMSRWLERCARRLGLTQRIGAPVLLLAQRKSLVPS
jgi:SAM-dependent methyltransferase